MLEDCLHDNSNCYSSIDFDWLKNMGILAKSEIDKNDNEEEFVP